MKLDAPFPRWFTSSPPLLLIVAVLTAFIALLVSLLADGVPIDTELSVALHTVIESLFVAATAAVFSVAWYAPRGEHRLRLTLAACLCLPVGFFSMLHFLTYPGMPELFVPGHQTMSFFFARIARFALPFALLALILTPATRVATRRMRWRLLGAMVVVMLPLAGFGISLAPEQSYILADTSYLRTITVVLFLLAAWLAYRHDGMERPDARYLTYAGLLGAVAEACLIPGISLGIGTPLKFLGHIYTYLAIVALFIAVYGEAVHHPYAELRRAHTTARHDKERLEAIMSSVADGVIVIDGQLRVIYANPVAYLVVCSPANNAPDMPLGQMLESLDDSGTAIVADVETSLREGGTLNDILYVKMTNRDDSIRAIEYSVLPVSRLAAGISGVTLVLRDITGRWQLQQQLLASANYARNLLETSPDPMIVIGPDGIISDVNRAAEQATGMERQNLVGAYFAARFTDPVSARIALQKALDGDTVRDLALTLARTGGGILLVSCNIAPHRETSGIRGAFAVVRDITDLHQAQLQMQFQAECDALTTLPNRRLFRERIEQALTRAAWDNRTVAVMVVDLDNFKDINDTLGHATGDELLKIIAQRLGGALRKTDTVARIGGDEFGVLVEENAATSDFQFLTDKILAAVTVPMQLAGRELMTSCSIGVSIHPIDPGNGDTLLKNADTAMFHTKQSGKNHCQYFKPEMNIEVQRRVDLGHYLRSALAHNELSLHYQPQIELQGGAIVGVEALLRWNSAELGFVSPAEFIPVAEDTGLILPIGAWVLKEACRQAARWREDTGTDMGVAVNISARQFRDEGLVDLVASELTASGLPPRLLELELTESMLMLDANRAADTMARLKELGTTLSIDDFGTGYSSLAYLKRFPLDALKIDRSFVMDVPGDPNDAAIVRSIVGLAHGLGLKVIAEGAETDAQMAFLRAHGCELVQGYYVSRPLPAVDLPTFVAKWHATQEPALTGRQDKDINPT